MKIEDELPYKPNIYRGLSHIWIFAGVNDSDAVANVIIKGIIPKTTKVTTAIEIEPPIFLINAPKKTDKAVTKTYEAKKYIK